MTTTKANLYKILFSTDQHFNSPKLDIEAQMARYLMLMFDCIRNDKPDAVVLGGDWFDRPTTMTSKAGVVILHGMTTLAKWCHVNKIALRVVKGTGTHDGTQNENWKPIAGTFDGLDFKVYDTVDVFSDLGFNVLTIPDSTIPNHHKCQMEIRRKLAEKGLEKVDLGFTHGMFTHHLEDAGYLVEAHDSDFYNSITDIVILNGHVHKPSLWESILTGGSCDRLRQGENHPKGIHLVTIDKQDKSFTAKFIENKDAAIFNSYDIMEENPDVAVMRLQEPLAALRASDIYVRLFYRSGVSIRPIESKLREQFPNIVFDCVPNAKDAEQMRKERELLFSKEKIPMDISNKSLIGLFEDKFKRMKVEFTEEHRKVLEEIRDVV